SGKKCIFAHGLFLKLENFKSKLCRGFGPYFFPFFSSLPDNPDPQLATRNPLMPYPAKCC
ncbi:hypothetical protein, partial [Pedobacter rhizosphaerae]|uniref:hypothetical protein n=1 Tax=Pedobacter rhizosphaerae TaxID=390241 RepID=UPI001C3153CC